MYAISRALQASPCSLEPLARSNPCAKACLALFWYSSAVSYRASFLNYSSFLPIHSSPKPLATTDVFMSFSFSMLYDQNHIVFSLFRLVSFTMQYTFKVLLCLFMAYSSILNTNSIYCVVVPQFICSPFEGQEMLILILVSTK